MSLKALEKEVSKPINSGSQAEVKVAKKKNEEERINAAHDKP